MENITWIHVIAVWLSYFVVLALGYKAGKNDSDASAKSLQWQVRWNEYFAMCTDSQLIATIEKVDQELGRRHYVRCDTEAQMLENWWKRSRQS